MAQIVLATVIVVACAIYAAWLLMPGAARRRLVRALLAAPLPKGLAASLAPHATAPTGCACDGCDRSALAPARDGPRAAGRAAAGAVPITFHPRRKP